MESGFGSDFGSDFGSGGGGGGKLDPGLIMEQVKVQIAVANAQELLQVRRGRDGGGGGGWAALRPGGARPCCRPSAVRGRGDAIAAGAAGPARRGGCPRPGPAAPLTPSLRSA